MALCKIVISDLLDAHHARHPIVEWGCSHELRDDFIPFGSIEGDGFQGKLCILSGSSLMPAPTWLREPQVLTTAIACDPLGTFLLGRTMKIINTNFNGFTSCSQGLLIEAFNNI